MDKKERNETQNSVFIQLYIKLDEFDIITKTRIKFAVMYAILVLCAMLVNKTRRKKSETTDKATKKIIYRI